MKQTNIDKEKLFAHEYVIDLDPIKAAIRAGFSKNNARAAGYRLIKKNNVRQIVLALMKQVHNNVRVDAERVLSELSKVGFSNIKDFVEHDNQLTDINDIEDEKTAAVESIQSETLFDGDGNKIVKTKLKLHSKLQALEMLGKHIGFFEKDNLQKPAEGIAGIKIEIVSPTKE